MPHTVESRFLPHTHGPGNRDETTRLDCLTACFTKYEEEKRPLYAPSTQRAAGSLLGNVQQRPLGSPPRDASRHNPTCADRQTHALLARPPALTLTRPV